MRVAFGWDETVYKAKNILPPRALQPWKCWIFYWTGFWLWFFDKDSIELKVLVLINSNVNQAFDCGEDKERSESWIRQVHPTLNVWTTPTTLTLKNMQGIGCHRRIRCNWILFLLQRKSNKQQLNLLLVRSQFEAIHHIESNQTAGPSKVYPSSK